MPTKTYEKFIISSHSNVKSFSRQFQGCSGGVHNISFRVAIKHERLYKQKLRLLVRQIKKQKFPLLQQKFLLSRRRRRRRHGEIVFSR